MTAATRIPAAAATPAHVRSRPMLIGAALGNAYVVWGSTYLAIRIMVEEMPPLVGAGVRSLTLIAVLLPVAGQGLVTVGEKGEAPSGITALLITANGVGGAFPPWTIAVVVLAGLSWAFDSWRQPRLRLSGAPFVVVVYEMLIGGGVLTILGLASGEGLRPLDFSARSWVAWAYLVGFGSVVAFSAYVWLPQSAAVSLAATYAYVNPLVAVLLGCLFLAEPMTMPTIAGGAVALAAVAIVVGSERPPRQPPLHKTTNGKSGKPGQSATGYARAALTKADPDKARPRR